MFGTACDSYSPSTWAAFEVFDAVAARVCGNESLPQRAWVAPAANLELFQPVQAQ